MYITGCGVCHSTLDDLAPDGSKKGDGLCRGCGGSQYSHQEEIKCFACLGRNICTTCDGSAKCTSCKGSGLMTTIGGGDTMNCLICRGAGTCEKCVSEDNGECPVCSEDGYSIKKHYCGLCAQGLCKACQGRGVVVLGAPVEDD